MNIPEGYKLNKPITYAIGGIHLFALPALFSLFFFWDAVFLMIFLHWATALLGICLGHHRYLTHHSLELPKWLGYFFVFLGTLTLESGPTKWVAYHMQHHLYSDKEEDPHNANRGFSWAHFGWLIYHDPKKDGSAESLSKKWKWAKEVREDKIYRFMDDYLVHIQVAFGLFIFLSAWYWYGSTTIALSFVIWGIFVRLVLVWHSTWFVNSASHWFGYKNFDLPKPDKSTNCWWVGLVAYGEGWHNNHHRWAQSARHGMKWWEIDMTYWVIWLLEKSGLATNVNEKYQIDNSI